MKILFVINGLGTGGAERSLVETIGADGSAIQPVVACLNRRSEGVQNGAEQGGLDVRFVGGGAPARVLALRRLLGELKPDLVHTTIFEADVAGRLAAASSSVPVVSSLVNTSYAPVRLDDPSVDAWKLRGAKAIDGWTARHLTSHFHAITGAVKDAAVRDLRVDPSRITVIERGRDPIRLGRPGKGRRLAARRALGVAPGALTLVTLGRQEFQKGQWNLIEAMPKILAGWPDAVLLLAGREGNTSERLRAAVRSAGVQGCVRFLGHRDDAPEILAAADLFVFPSLYEGLGGALIEAMALGLPIVASDLPAIREVVEPGVNAVLVPAGSPDDLAGAVLSVATDVDRRARMGERSRAIFEERFTIERSARRMVELLERVAADGGRPAR